MFNIDEINKEDKESFYKDLMLYLEGLLSDEEDWLANLSNAAALLYNMMDRINWAGFYLLKGSDLVLGPFQGKPACTRIPIGKGVCGTAAEKRQVQLVEDVDRFPGHIACDPASRSEIVLPIIVDDRILGVLDIDSPIKARFDHKDAAGLEDFVSILCGSIKWPL
ncbi:MAG: GAF domain-containing protein [Caldicoprobacterales bacterium]